MKTSTIFKTAAKTLLPYAVLERLKRLNPLTELAYSTKDDALTSYAQEGEDILLYSLLGLYSGAPTGFYVDVGAHHPSRYSNTLFFYLRGWRGINIDPMPGSMCLFNKVRPNDINLEFAVSDRDEILTYYSFSEPALNGFSKELSEKREKFGQYHINSEQEIATHRLDEILEQHLPKGQNIDFLSVDVEGLDYQVLASNSWDKYRPKVVLVEDSEVNDLVDAGASQIVSLMRQQNYVPVCKTRLTLLFIEQSQFQLGPLGLYAINKTSE